MSGTTGFSVYKFTIDVVGTNSAGLVDSTDEHGTHGFININDTSHIMFNAKAYTGDGYADYLESPGTYGNFVPDNFCDVEPGTTINYTPIDLDQSSTASASASIDFGQYLNTGAVFSGEFLHTTLSNVQHWLFFTNDSNPSAVTFEIYYLLTGGATWTKVVPTGTGSSYSITFSESKTPGCFVEGTKLLVHVHDKDLYVNIEDLRTGDLVNTYLHGKKAIKFIGKGQLKNDKNQWNNCIRRLPKSGDMTDDLLVTGAHSILVDELSEKESEGMVAIYGTADRKIDDKTLVLSWVSDKFEAIDDEEYYTYYHLVLENDDTDKRFGIWANGVLTESQCEKHFLAKPYELL
jgi:hypothetical protein